jgi:electron transfer flavoprotein beta subunit
VAPPSPEDARLLQLVCLKQVPDTETKVKVAPDGRTLDPAGVTLVMNPYDEFALEEALRVKEKLGAGEVVVVSVGGPGVQTTLRSALAMGADRAIHLKSEQPAPDSLQVARALVAAIRDLPGQLVWFGKQAVDDDCAQVPSMVAELLGRPSVSQVAHFVLEDGKAVVERDVEGAREVVELVLPAVLSTDKGLNEPRYASLKGIMAAKKKPIEERAAELGDPVLEVVALELPPPRAPGRIVGAGVDAVPELVRVLHEEAKLI